MYLKKELIKTTGIALLATTLSLVTSCKEDDNKEEPSEMMKDPVNSTKVKWNYSDKGPSKWGELSADFILCAEGQKQSPIDLNPSTIVNKGDATALVFNYKEDAVFLALNNTHTNEFKVDKGSFVTFNGKQFQLAQFHGHAGSENTIAGVQSPLELHFVHVAADGELLVVGVLIDEGAENPNYASFWTEDNFLETEKEEVEDLVSGTHDLTKLFPLESPLYQFSGSLTTPPCSEGVNWNVLTQKITMSSAQIKLFTDIFDNNFRPIQELNDREVISTEDAPVPVASL